jgi:hypothetical protein
MSMTTDPAARAALISGLRKLADFLAANPDVAVSKQGADISLTPYGDDDTEAREIAAFADAAGIDVLDDRASGGKMEAAIVFGPITYRAFTYSSATLAESDARRSYERNVQVASPAPLAEIAQAA